MAERFFALGVLGALGASGLVMIVSIWIRPGKKGPEWMMAASTLAVVAGLGFMIWPLIADLLGTRQMQEHIEETSIAIGLGVMSLAAGLFAAGFLWDRIQRRDEER